MSPGVSPSAGLLIFAGASWLAAASFVWISTNRRTASASLLLGLVVAFALAAVVSAAVSGPRHDYLAFLEEWEGIVAGHDPWDEEAIGSKNAYGPIFAALAPATFVHTLAPKLLFVAAWIGVAAWFLRLYITDADLEDRAPAVVAYFVLTPYFWVEIALYGHFDILPAVATLVAVHLALRRHELAAGAALGVGALLKLAPLAALPLLAATRREGASRLVVGCATVFLGGAAVAYGIWGASVLEPLRFAADRESSLLSIFQFLRGEYSPLRLVADDPDVDALSGVALFVAFATLLIVVARRRTHPVAAVVAGFVLVFALYTVGNPQFQMIVFVLAPYLYASVPDVVRTDRLFLVALGVYLAWFTAFDVLYVISGMMTEGVWLDIRQLVGLPTFVLALGTFAVLMRVSRATLHVPGGESERPAPARVRRALSTTDGSSAS